MKKKIKIIGIIPARLKCTRLPEKLLLEIRNKPLVYYTYMQTKKSKIDDVIIAVDHKKIFDKLLNLNCKVTMTSNKHKSGTDRIGEAAQKHNGDFYVNIQGDEPLIKPGIINKMIDYINNNPDTEILTAGKYIKEKNEINNPNIVKVVHNKNHQALYFSRHSIPFNRNKNENIQHIKHIGIYAYRKDILKKIIRLPCSILEKIEKLEQLRFLENGFKINIIITGMDTISVDTKEDFLKVKKIIERKS